MNPDSLLHGEAACDLGLASGNLFLNDRGGIDGLVQNDRKPLLDVVPGDLVKELRARAVEGQGDIGFVELSEGHAGIADHVAAHQGPGLEKVGDPASPLVGRIPVQKFLSGRKGRLAVQKSCRIGRIVRQLELQPGRLSDQGHGPFRVGHPRKLNQDPVLSLLFDDRFGHAKLVDPVPDDLHGLGHGVLFYPQDFALGKEKGESGVLVRHLLEIGGPG